MVLMSKIRAMFCLSLIILLGVQLKCGSGVPLIPHKQTVQITNRLVDRYLGVQCKEKQHDLGVHQINVGESYSFKFYPNYFFDITLYYCHFVWLEGDHYFDIYDEHRDDYCDKNLCSWEIFATGPCKFEFGSRKCFKWNKLAAGQRLLLEESNSTLSM